MRAVLSTDNCPMPQYTLYVRRSDHTLHLVERDTHKPVSIEAIIPVKAGLIVRPRDGYGVCLMKDEVHVVDEFPASQCSLNGKALLLRREE